MSKVKLLAVILLCSVLCSAEQRRTADAKFWIVNGALIGAATADITLTQRCIAERRCYEGNPLLPDSTAGRIGVFAAETGLAVTASYWLKRLHARAWWVGPAIGVGAHSMGIASGVKFGF